MGILNKLKKQGQENILQIVENTHLIKRYILLVIAVFIYASAYNLFFFKNNIVYGGVSGISIITQKLIDPAIMILILNLLFLIVSYFTLGKRQTIDSIVGSLLFPMFVKLTKNIADYIIIDNSNLLLVVLIGGVCIGFASGIIFKTGFTTGGTDILNQVVSKYFKISIGTSMLITDGLILIISGFFFGWTRVLYAIVVLYILNIMVDKVVLGISNNKAVYITTTEENLVSNYLMNELNLGLTFIETKGGYLKRKKEMIMCVVPTSDYFRLSEGIQRIDKNAVILVTDAYQTSGTYSSKRKG